MDSYWTELSPAMLLYHSATHEYAYSSALTCTMIIEDHAWLYAIVNAPQAWQYIVYNARVSNH